MRLLRTSLRGVMRVPPHPSDHDEAPRMGTGGLRYERFDLGTYVLRYIGTSVRQRRWLTGTLLVRDLAKPPPDPFITVVME